MSTVEASGRIDELLSAVEARFGQANPNSRRRHERACEVLPAGHTRQTLYYHPFPLTIVRGEGAHITDLDGHRYLNLVGDYAAGVFGHSCEPIRAAVLEALAGGVSLSGVNTREVELAELICARIPSIEQVRFCNSGSEACVFAALLARHATARQKLLVFNGAYHGGFMIYGDVDPPLNVPFDIIKSVYNDIERTRTVLRQNAASLAAVFVEPVMGSAGCIPASREFLAMLREETARLGIVLVFDEVMTSRLGPGAVQGLHGIRPDLTTLGKFWGGGFGFGAFGGSRELMRHFNAKAGGVLSQAGTFNNNIMTMSAGLVGARDVYTPDACIGLNARGDALRERINALASEAGVALQATGLGGVMCLHWNNASIRNPSQVGPANSPLRRLFHVEMMMRGYYLAQRGMMTVSLPVTQADLDQFTGALSEFLRDHADVLPHVG